MHVIQCSHIEEALNKGLFWLRENGNPEDSRNGPVYVSPTPVTTIYTDPKARVLLNPVRDANPFFHLFESLWIVAGRRDVAFLSQFVKGMADYSDDGQFFHAPYGHRLRGGEPSGPLDQIRVVVDMLRQDPASRRACLQIWDASRDLDTRSKDLPCNDFLMLRVRDEQLDLTVANRSNDIIWGAYGANAVQFSVLQEYIAAKLNVEVGYYYQVSNNYHAYASNAFWKWWVERYPVGIPTCENPYFGPDAIDATAIFTPSDVDNVEHDIAYMLGTFDAWQSMNSSSQPMGWVYDLDTTMYRSEFFVLIAHWMLLAYAKHKGGHTPDAIQALSLASPVESDWCVAGRMWLDRRLAK